MKKIFFVLALLGVTVLQAQTTHFGVKAGFNLSSLSVDGDDDYDSKVGFHGGLLAHIHLTKQFAVQPELVYSGQGGKDGDIKLKLGYLNLPVLLQYMAGSGFRLQTGPQLGFLTSAKVDDDDVEYDVKDDLNSVDVSWVFGGGYLSSSGLGVDVRFNLGLTNVNEDDFPEVKNRVFQFGLFYQFMGRKKR